MPAELLELGGLQRAPQMQHSEHGLPRLPAVQLLAEEPQQQHGAPGSLPVMPPGRELPGVQQPAPSAKSPLLGEPLPSAAQRFMTALVGPGWALTCRC